MRMFKKIYALLLAGCFASAMIGSTAVAADLKVSGYVKGYFASVSNNVGEYEEGIGVADSGNKKSASYTAIAYDEAELKFKGTAETPNGWKTYGEIELELKGKNTFDLEEASLNVDFGPVMLSMGILEDWSTHVGTAYPMGLSERDTKFADETEALRVSLKAVPKLKLDLKLRMYPEDYTGTSGGSSPANMQETRLQSKFDFGIGWASLVYATLAGSAVDSDEKGDWKSSKNAVEAGLGFKFGPVEPFLLMITETAQDTKAAAGSDEVKKDWVETRLGLDFGLGAHTITFVTALTAYNYTGEDSSKPNDGLKTPYAKISMGLAAEFGFKPVNFFASYYTASNNDKAVKDAYDTTGYNATATTIAAGAYMKF